MIQIYNLYGKVVQQQKTTDLPQKTADLSQKTVNPPIKTVYPPKKFTGFGLITMTNWAQTGPGTEVIYSLLTWLDELKFHTIPRVGSPVGGKKIVSAKT